MNDITNTITKPLAVLSENVSGYTNIYAGFIRSSDAAAADALGNVFDRIKQRQEIG